MPLTIYQQENSTIPTWVTGITPENVAGLSIAEIENLPIEFGNQRVALGERFRVKGTAASLSVIWEGNLEAVHDIGAGMSRGSVHCNGSAGRHVGRQMTGGKIVVQGNAGDYAGVEMTGGLLEIQGNVGNGVGGNLPGSIYGMNRGVILIQGDAGRGVGQKMRRGLIAIGGNTEELTGWHMLAGSIIVMGKCGRRVGAEMKRGTIVCAQPDASLAGPTFLASPVTRPPVLPLLAKQLKRIGFKFDPAQLLEREFVPYAGDVLYGARGELFVAAK